MIPLLIKYRFQYGKFRVEKNLNLLSRKICLIVTYPYIAYSIRNNLPSKKYYGSRIKEI
jgi:hypothetical protein